MTVKLYYEDAYIKSFTARVLSSEPSGELYDVVLDRTAFFPEEGGQYSDTGLIMDSRVSSVFERSGTVHHLVTSPIPVGETVSCSIDFDERYEKMQCHTAEHILSGIFHSEYGYDNVGFHLGAEIVTMDINAILSEEQIERVELLANRAVYANVPVSASFPEADELSALEYRSKLDLTENVRIVTIVGYDSCACCAPHVARTGEIGIIRITDFVKHRGGTRITMSAGIRAYREIKAEYASIKRISRALSTPRVEIADGVEKLLSDLEFSRSEYKSARAALMAAKAENLLGGGENYLALLEGATADELRELSNLLLPSVRGILVLLGGEAPERKYVISSETVNLSAEAKKINAALSGRGGGKPCMIQGALSADLDSVIAYFENFNAR